jgi:hypothetical protein
MMCAFSTASKKRTLRYFFWYFWLTIQNKADRQVRNLFCLLAVFISFPLARALLLLRRQLRIFAAAAAGKYQNKTSSGVKTLICVCTRNASGSTEDSCAGTQPQNPVGRRRH